LSRFPNGNALLDYRRLTYASLLVLAGDTDRYRRLCREDLDRYGRSQDAATLMIADRPSVLARGALADFSLSIQMAERALAGNLPDRNYWPGCTLYVLGAACYRAGQFDRAVHYCRESVEKYSEWPGTMLNWPVLALARHGLGNADESRRWLSMAKDRFISIGRSRLNIKTFSGEELAYFVNWLELKVWLREAECVILYDRGFPADPFAPPG
jgi:hypothetical protein